MLPKNANILLSVVNTKLRDEFASLEELCERYDENIEDIKDILKTISYYYDDKNNRFVHISVLNK